MASGLLELDRFRELAAVARGVSQRDLALPFDQELVFNLAEAGNDQELNLRPVFLIGGLIAVGVEKKAAGDDLGAGAAHRERVLGIEIGLLGEIAYRRHRLG